MPPVSLVIFDFDATLSLYTFMPDDVTCAEQIGAKLSPDDAKTVRAAQLRLPVC